MLTEEIGIPQLKSAVKYARGTGYLTHDIRNPDFFTVDQNESIKILDKAFIDAANSLNMSYESFAGYGESSQALKVSDELADQLIDDSDDEIKYKSVDIYGVALPFFKMNMKKWMSTMDVNQLAKLKEYWVRHAY